MNKDKTITGSALVANDNQALPPPTSYEYGFLLGQSLFMSALAGKKTDPASLRQDMAERYRQRQDASAAPGLILGE